MKNLFTLKAVILAFMCTGTAVVAGAKEVRIASHVSELSPLHAQSVLFVQEVEKRLPGQFEFKIYPSAQLGKESALIQNVRAGSLEMINVASGVVKLDRKLGIFDLPWLFTDRAHVIRTMSGPLGNEVKNLIESKNVKVIGIYENGFRHVLNTKRSITDTNSIRGLKLRISGGSFRRGVFSKLGVQPQSVAWKETFTALQTGVVDGVEAAAYGFYEQKQYEVSKFMSLTSHVYTPSFLLASNAFWHSLNPEQQKVFTQVGKIIESPSYVEAEKLENKYLNEMAKFITINKVDLTDFQQKTKDSYAKYIKSSGDSWIKLVQDAQ